MTELDFRKVFPPSGEPPMQTVADVHAFIHRPGPSVDRGLLARLRAAWKPPPPKPSPFARAATPEDFARFAGLLFQPEEERKPAPLHLDDMAALSKTTLALMAGELSRSRPALAEAVRSHLKEREREHVNFLTVG
jgi:hypothetical protein